MCYWLLPKSGIPIARTTIQPLSQEELATETIKHELHTFDISIAEKLNTIQDDLSHMRIYREDEDEAEEPLDPLVEPDSRAPEIDTIEADAYDELLLTEPILAYEGNFTKAKVIGRKRDENGEPVGIYNKNPLLNTRIYLAEFPNGHIAEFSANVISEAIYNQVNDDGTEELLFSEIIGHEQDTPKELTTQETNRYTTKGWRICITWKDGSTSWHSLSDIKNSYPIQLAEYAIANNLQNEPAFVWWIKPTLKRKKAFIKTTRARYAKRSHKFGIRVPQTVEEAIAIDKATNTTFWHNAIQKEMKNNRIAFKFLDNGEPVPIGYKWIKCHMIFDVKMDFTRKARFVAGGHMTDPPPSITYSSVVSRDSVRIAFLLAALNDVDIMATDIGNAYLHAPPREKVYTTAGPEFGAELQGQSVLIVRALYGLKSSGAAWRSHLANTLNSMGFMSSLADADVWLRPSSKPDGFQYYEYVLVYVDDLLVLSHQAPNIMQALENFYRLKDGYSKPTRYLGAEVKEW
jgi:hypothetical protein